jgi:hypothetical protein
VEELLAEQRRHGRSPHRLPAVKQFAPLFIEQIFEFVPSAEYLSARRRLLSGRAARQAAEGVCRMPSMDEVIAAKDRVEGQSSARPAVMAVDIGYEEVGGRLTDRFAMVTSQLRPVPDHPILQERSGVRHAADRKTGWQNAPASPSCGIHAHPWQLVLGGRSLP